MNDYLQAAWEFDHVETPTQQLILTFLAARVDRLGIVRTTVADIAAYCRVSEQVARTVLRMLVNKEIIDGTVPPARRHNTTHQKLVLEFGDALFEQR